MHLDIISTSLLAFDPLCTLFEVAFQAGAAHLERVQINHSWEAMSCPGAGTGRAGAAGQELELGGLAQLEQQQPFTGISSGRSQIRRTHGPQQLLHRFHLNHQQRQGHWALHQLRWQQLRTAEGAAAGSGATTG